MCGIVGFYDSTLDSNESALLIQKMLDVTNHRGPDKNHFKLLNPLALGHNRLKIIDLSDEAEQPMTRGNLTLCFNGEIYNYIELRCELEKKGYKFTTKSDTEVIIKAYREWGETCVSKFVGMWAFSIWDSNENKLFISRDRFGIKPLYYIYESEKIYFASETKSLKSSKIFKNKININQANIGITVGWISNVDKCYYEGVNLLPPAHNLVFKEGKVKVYRYWDLDPQNKNELSFEENKYIFSKMFEESIKIHLRSDVKIGGCLSGGLDSSAIASSISNLFPELTYKIFNIYYSGSTKEYIDERPFVNEVLNKYQTIKPHFFTPSEDELYESLLKATYHADVPVNRSSYLSQYFLMQMAYKNDVRVLIDGQGADEYLGGYMHSFYPLLVQMMKKGKLIDAAKLLFSHVKRQGYSPVKAKMIVLKTLLTLFKSDDIIFKYDLCKIGCLLDEKVFDKCGDVKFFDYSNNIFDNFSYNLTFLTSLPTLLHFGDTNSMAFSIESRVPFLDHRIVEFMYSTKDTDKINLKAETKFLMREALADILPHAIKERKDKKGFVTPGETVWLRGPLSHLLEINYNNLYWLNKEKISKMIEKYKKGDNSNAITVWCICMLNLWIKENF